LRSNELAGIRLAPGSSGRRDLLCDCAAALLGSKVLDFRYSNENAKHVSPTNACTHACGFKFFPPFPVHCLLLRPQNSGASNKHRGSKLLLHLNGCAKTTQLCTKSCPYKCSCLHAGRVHLFTHTSKEMLFCSSVVTSS
jgi:hypothetical protein